jgi:hypothetical protein
MLNIISLSFPVSFQIISYRLSLVVTAICIHTECNCNNGRTELIDSLSARSSAGACSIRSEAWC